MKPFHWLLLGASIPVLLIVLWGWLDTACAPHALVASGETFLTCSRSWFGALSGWMAAAAAGCTILVLFRQIEKNEETAHRKQTEARTIFDAEASRLLSDLNMIWKNAEDVLKLQVGRREKFGHLDNQMKQRVKQLRTQFKFVDFQAYIASMHPLDGAKREKLLMRIDRCISPLSSFNHDQDERAVSETEPEEIAYFMLLCFELSFLSNYIKKELPNLSGVFKNRTPMAVDHVQELSKEFAEDGWRTGFPNNPDNPY